MADQVTGSTAATKKEKDPNDAVHAALDAAKEAMVAAGMPADQADALLNAARPNGTGTVVGNYADLQRMGAIAQTGVMPTSPAEDDLKTTDIKEAFVDNSVDTPTDIDADRLAYAHKLDKDAPVVEPTEARAAELKSSAAQAAAQEKAAK